MIAYAATGKREDVLAGLAKVKGTEKDKDNDAFHKAVADAVTEEVGKIPAENTTIALEVKARATDDKSGGVKHLKIVAHPITTEEKE